MRKLKIYSVAVTIIAICLSIWIFELSKNLKETDEVLQQCSDRYYKELQK